MFRLAWRGVIARFGRILLTALAIIASTAFLSGTFIFKDTVGRTFDALFAQVYDDVDAYVQSGDTIETAFGFEVRGKIALDTVDLVATVPGVADAQAFVQGDAVVIDRAGDPVSPATSPRKALTTTLIRNGKVLTAISRAPTLLT
jgi:putative ABC transport system permease protein